jgi:hypothetical protein
MPCAGYSGFVIEPCSGRFLIREEPRYAMHAPTNCQPFGRSDRPLAALSAVTICDAIRIGFLRQSLKLSSAGLCLTETSQIVKRRKRNNVTDLSTERRVAREQTRRGDTQRHPLLRRRLRPASPHRPHHAGGRGSAAKRRSHRLPRPCAGRCDPRPGRSRRRRRIARPLHCRVAGSRQPQPEPLDRICALVTKRGATSGECYPPTFPPTQCSAKKICR